MKKQLNFRRAWELEISDDRLSFFIANIDKDFPTEEIILQEFERVIWGASGLHCASCKSTSVYRPPLERRWKCEECFHITYLTAGTIFHGMKHPRAWLILIKLFGARMNISASRFHKFVGVSASASLIMYKKIGTVIEAAYADETIEISTAAFSKIFSKRSRETPSQKHPRTEQNIVDRHVARESRIIRLAEFRDAMEDAGIEDRIEEGIEDGIGIDAEIDVESEVDLIAGSQALIDIEHLKKTHLKPEDGLSDSAYTVYDLITDEPIVFDEILSQLNIEVGLLSANLTMLELRGLVRRLAGDHYIRRQPGDIVENEGEKRKRQIQEESLEIIVAAIASIHHGVSRKDFQKFFSLFLIFIDEERWDEEKLFAACAKHKDLSAKKIAKEITAPSIKVPAVCFELAREMLVY